MLFRQLLDEKSRTFTYLVASRRGGEALLIDPVRDQLPLYLRLADALDLRLVYAFDTHSHNDHDSALELLLEQTECVTVMGRESEASWVIRRLSEGEVLDVDGLELTAMHTPGHTDDSYSLLMDDRVFTGDTLLIRGTGRTDLGGDSREQYESLFGKLLQLPGRTLVYPAHDYNGRHVSSISDERRLNPRLQAASVDEYIALMDSVRPSDPRLSDYPEAPSLHPDAPLMRELMALKSVLAAGSVLGDASNSP
ncbi:MAG TPA: MBL fold metallo-hydrolase [Polyangiaceae bacterium]|nr:MBL fold metallo-hydrolase [Polyangiaceae bacterium]